MRARGPRGARGGGFSSSESDMHARLGAGPPRDRASGAGKRAGPMCTCRRGARPARRWRARPGVAGPAVPCRAGSLVGGVGLAEPACGLGLRSAGYSRARAWSVRRATSQRQVKFLVAPAAERRRPRPSAAAVATRTPAALVTAARRRGCRFDQAVPARPGPSSGSAAGRPAATLWVWRIGP